MGLAIVWQEKVEVDCEAEVDWGPCGRSLERIIRQIGSGDHESGADQGADPEP